MVATQPKFNVDFKELAVMAIQRQQRGAVIMILDDSTSDIDNVTYRGLGDVDADDWTTANYKRIQLAFLGNPSKVIVVKKESSFADIQAKLNLQSNYTLCYPEAATADITSIKNYLKAQREANNYSRAVVANATSPDVDYMINFVSSGNITAKIGDEAEEFTAGDWTARLAGALSGLAPSRSLTYYELPEVVEAPISTTPDTDVAAGKLIILHQDGSYKFGRAVNSLVTLTDGVTEAFQKIRVLDIMDMIANDIVATFRLYYVGKYTNNFTNKNRFVGAINAYLKQLAAEGLLESENDNEVEISYEKNKAYLESKGVDTSTMTYIQILKANTGSKVLLDGVCSPTDAMEDLDLGMYLFQALQAE
jgi:hypothetical protein